MLIPSGISGGLDQDCLHLWSALMPSSQDEVLSSNGFSLISVLSDDERSRAERYQVQTARQQFIVTRALLRTLLGEYLQQDPKKIEFCYSVHGKPELLRPPANLCFNISHSRGMVLFAVRQNQPVGVDLEWINPAVKESVIARRLFSTSEQAEINGLPPLEQQAKFFQLWTRKEALIKLFGDRLFSGLKTYKVSAIGSLGGFWISVGQQSVWLQDLDCVESFAAAIATPTPPDHVQHHRWEWLSHFPKI
jgi:4'-phosphopantetheinyl transferase